jgi:hypothetical protein
MPTNPAHPRIEVPYLCTEIYEGPFQSFPERMGWTDDKILNHGTDIQDVEELKAFLQTWLSSVFWKKCLET